MKKILVIGLLLLTGVFALANSSAKKGTFELTFGQVRGPDGKIRAVKGVAFDAWLEKMDPEKVRKLYPVRAFQKQAHRDHSLRFKRKSQYKDFVSLAMEVAGRQLMANMAASPAMSTVVYNNENQAGAAILGGDWDDADPSALDDLIMSGGAGNLWQEIAMGIDIGADRWFIIRWIIYDDHVGDQGFDNSSFANIVGGEAVGDFGGILKTNQLPGWQGPGTYWLHIPIPPQGSWPGIVCPDDSIYMAQSFLNLLFTSLTDYDYSMQNVYNIASSPTVGSTTDGFYFDWDSRNSIYSENELEFLGDIDGSITGLSNIMRSITVGGSSETVNPASGSVFGNDIQGLQWLDLFDSDDSYISFKPRYDVARGDANGSVTVLGQMTGSTSVAKIIFNCEAAASLPDGIQKIDFWNWTTGAWDQMDSRNISSTDTNVTVNVTSNFTRYINAQKRLQARISFFPLTNIDRSYRMRVDRMAWTVLHP